MPEPEDETDRKAEFIFELVQKDLESNDAVNAGMKQVATIGITALVVLPTVLLRTVLDGDTDADCWTVTAITLGAVSWVFSLYCFLAVMAARKTPRGFDLSAVKGWIDQELPNQLSEFRLTLVQSFLDSDLERDNEAKKKASFLNWGLASAGFSTVALSTALIMAKL